MAFGHGWHPVDCTIDCPYPHRIDLSVELIRERGERNPLATVKHADGGASAELSVLFCRVRGAMARATRASMWPEL